MADLKETGAWSLYLAHVGKGLGSLSELNCLAFRSFENEIIVLNDNYPDQNSELSIPALFPARSMIDLYTSMTVQIRNKKIEVTIPAKSARVYLLP